MPRDLTNMPFDRSPAFRSNSTEAEVSPDEKLNTTLNIENMLLEEFNYISLTAYQAMEDRARVSTLYYILLGALLSGLLAIYQSSRNTLNDSQPLVIALLIAAGIINISYCCHRT